MLGKRLTMGERIQLSCKAKAGELALWPQMQGLEHRWMHIISKIPMLSRCKSQEGKGSILDGMAVLPSVENFICILQNCTKNKNLEYAKRVHAHICNHGLEAYGAVGDYIVPMFVDCGSVSDAQLFVNGFASQIELSCTSRFIQCRHLCQKMQEDSLLPSCYTLMALLKACAKLKNLEHGREIHADIAQKAFEMDLFVSNTLIGMYAKCGSLSESLEVFDKLPGRDVVSWNALIAGYAKHGHGVDALKCFEDMQSEGVSPNAVTFVSVLKSCSNVGAIGKGQEIHAEIAQKGFERELFVGNTLVDMYAKCGSLSEACEVFENLPARDVVSWNALIAGYVECGLGEEALKCFEQMQIEGVFADVVTCVSILKACGSIGAIGKGRYIHAEITLKGFIGGLFLGNTLVDMYSRCGSLLEARAVFDKLLAPDIVSWNSLIAGYAEHGPGDEALNCFEQMQLKGISPDAVTFACILKATGSIVALDKGREIHSKIIQKGFERDIFVSSTLVDMYAKCGSLTEAREAFQKLPFRNAVSWAALIAGYAEHGPGQDALNCFNQMQLEGVGLDAVTFVCLLKACCRLGALAKGQQVHAVLTQNGFGRDLFVGNNLIDMYVKCSSLTKAQEVLEKLSVRNVVSWSTLMAGYAVQGPVQEVLKCLQQMHLEGISPNAVTFVSVLKACSSLGLIHKGREIHAEIAQKGFGGNLFVSNTLVDMYAKCGSLLEAQEVFDKVPARNVVSWNTLIAGYEAHGPCQEALDCFEQMQLEGVCPDSVTFAIALKACGSIGAIRKGREMHAEIIQKGFERDLLVGNTLVDMYGKFGSLAEARKAFDNLPVQDVVSWNAMIKGYGTNHEGNLAVQCFELMQEQGVKPDASTFTCLLIACSHTNMVSEGQEYFKVMSEEYGGAPTIDQHICMVDLLARAGHLEKAEKLLDASSPSKEMLTALLSACKTYGEAELGHRCFQKLVQMNPESATSYVLMTDIYVSASRLDDAYRIEDLRKHAGAKKKPAGALIEVNKEVHEFIVGKNKSKEFSAMIQILSSRVKTRGHVPNLDLILTHSACG